MIVMVVVTVAIFGFIALVIYKIAQRRNWARILYLSDRRNDNSSRIHAIQAGLGKVATRDAVAPRRLGFTPAVCAPGPP
jgi:hypothetical protein